MRREVLAGSASISRLLRSIDSRRSVLLDTVAQLSASEQVWRADARSWSAVEIIEHLVLAEQLVLGDFSVASVRREHPRSARHRVRALLVWFVLRFGIRVSVPAESMRPSGAASFTELRAQWIEQHRLLRAYVEALDARGLNRRVFHHPIAGPLSVRDALQLLDAHLGTHQRQVARSLHSLRRMSGNTPPSARTTDAPTPSH